LFARVKAIPTVDLPEMRSSRLILRPLEVGDAARVYAAIDHSRVEFTRWFTWAQDATPMSTRQNLQEGRMAMIAGSEWHYGIFDRVQCFCGRIGLSEIDHKAHRAELGYWLDKEVHGRAS
jgi:RimJ/RimL family protein N-acetyltransferase